ncbi:hypothetical protein V2J09_023995 [Rumex salicifolius]
MGMAAVEQQFHVLAVDDSLLDRKLIERLLKTSSFQVTTVDSGSKALEFLGFEEDEEQSNSNQPSVSPKSEMELEKEQKKASTSTRKKDVEVNLIITDYCMPGMTGYDLLKKIKESSSLRKIPVVIMSSEHVPSRINRCLEEGAEEFFLKPVKLSDVNKLKPHMLKATHDRQKDQEKSEEEKSEEDNDDYLQKPNQQQQQTESQQEQQKLQTNNKRKSMDEGMSPDRTRPRYSGLTVTLPPTLYSPTSLLIIQLIQTQEGSMYCVEMKSGPVLSALSRSEIKSFTSSIPTEMRTRSSVRPLASRTSAGMLA